MASYFETSARSTNTWSIWIRNPYPFEAEDTASIVKMIKEVFDVEIIYTQMQTFYHEIYVTGSWGGPSTPRDTVEWVAAMIQCLHVFHIHQKDCRLMIFRGKCEWVITSENRKPDWVQEIDQQLAEDDE